MKQVKIWTKIRTKIRKRKVAATLSAVALTLASAAYAADKPSISDINIATAADVQEIKGEAAPVTQLLVTGHFTAVERFDCDGDQHPDFTDEFNNSQYGPDKHVMFVRRLETTVKCKLVVYLSIGGAKRIFVPLDTDSNAIFKLPSAAMQARGTAPGGAAAAATAGGAPSITSTGDAGGDFTIRDNVQNLLVTASVRNSSLSGGGSRAYYDSFSTGRRTDLGQNYFKVLIDGQDASDSIQGFGSESMDTTIGILIDTSGSMETIGNVAVKDNADCKKPTLLCRARDAARTLIAQLQPRLDNFFIVHFSHDVAINDEPFSATRPPGMSIGQTFANAGDPRAPYWVYRMQPIEGVTFDPNSIATTSLPLRFKEYGYDDTELFAAIERAVTVLKDGSDEDARLKPQAGASYKPMVHRRTILFLITDGVDRTGRMADAVRVALANNVEINAIGILDAKDKDERKKGMEILDQITSKTGGLAVYPTGPDELESLARAFVDDMHMKYHFAVALSDKSAAPGCHQVQVSAYDPRAIESAYQAQLVGTKEEFLNKALSGYSDRYGSSYDKPTGYTRTLERFEDSKKLSAAAFFTKYAAECFAKPLQCKTHPESCRPVWETPSSSYGSTGGNGSYNGGNSAGGNTYGSPNPYGSANAQRTAPGVNVGTFDRGATTTANGASGNGYPAVTRPAAPPSGGWTLADAAQACRCEYPLNLFWRPDFISCEYKDRNRGFLCDCGESYAACRYRTGNGPKPPVGFTPRAARDASPTADQQAQAPAPVQIPYAPPSSNNGVHIYNMDPPRASNPAPAPAKVVAAVPPKPLTDDDMYKLMADNCGYLKDLVDEKRSTASVEDMLAHHWSDPKYDPKRDPGKKKKSDDSSGSSSEQVPDYLRSLHEWNARKPLEDPNKDSFLRTQKNRGAFPLSVIARTEFGDSCY